ncbi:unannotated protein [freshwater metagenome]|uniref:Unannotated protein n=1 Tax=freshwater metagenome TaxID=449393 RepID=A0A6J6GT86_9ZZZZ
MIGIHHKGSGGGKLSHGQQKSFNIVGPSAIDPYTDQVVIVHNTCHRLGDRVPSISHSAIGETETEPCRRRSTFLKNLSNQPSLISQGDCFHGYQVSPRVNKNVQLMTVIILNLRPLNVITACVFAAISQARSKWSDGCCHQCVCPSHSTSSNQSCVE